MVFRARLATMANTSRSTWVVEGSLLAQPVLARRHLGRLQITGDAPLADTGESARLRCKMSAEDEAWGVRSHRVEAGLQLKTPIDLGARDYVAGYLLNRKAEVHAGEPKGVVSLLFGQPLLGHEDTLGPVNQLATA